MSGINVWSSKMTRRRLMAVAPAILAALGIAVAASSSPRSEIEQRSEVVRKITGGRVGDAGLWAIARRMTPAQIALAERHDPTKPKAHEIGLTPGWENLSLGGKPSLDLGVNGLAAQRLNALTPDALGSLRVASPFVFKPASSADRSRALRCLTQGIYYEAALEPTAGQEAVAQVILNRVRDPNYANSICGVVFEGAERMTGCQFSFTCDGSLGQAPVSWAWNRARLVAERMLAGHVARRVGTATHYHADYVHPWWAPTLNKLTQIGAHIFYRWKGVYGEPAAFRQVYSGREPLIDEVRFARPRLPLPAITEGDGPLGVQNASHDGQGIRTVEINGQTRVVGVASLGGRRQATPDDIAAINARLAAFEPPPKEAASAKPSQMPAGVTAMEVEEVGRPGV